MNPKTDKLLQQAGKYIALGKLTLALEQYLKIQEAEPDDTTIVNTIGDLYVRLDDKDNALLWYHKLAEAFEYRELHSNAMATYRKILKLSPKNQEAMTLLAQLCERQGQVQNAKTHYQMLAKLKSGLNDHTEAIKILKRVCNLDPSCGESQMVLAQSLELGRNIKDAIKAYLQSATLYAQQGNPMAASQVVENIFRLQPKDKDTVKSFFMLLQKIDLNQRGLQYLNSLALDEDPEFKLILSEMFLEEGNFETARQLIQGSVRQYPTLYKPAIKILEGMIARRDLNGSLEMVEDLLEISMRLRDESTLKVLLDSLLELDETNSRLLKTLTTVLIRMDDKEQLEGYLKRLVLLQLRSDEVRDARESLNKLVVYGSSSFYLDLLNLINEATLEPEVLKKAIQKVIRALEAGSLEKDQTEPSQPLALGVSELDLGMGLTFEEEIAFMQESA
ncbi:MAG TPA: tetratricopeptide repeat protein [Terriglobia bacterium]|nr:tetratricopeptide repeat protein [Terriglobia bacterium]